MTQAAIPTASRRLATVQTPIIPVIADLIKQHPGTISLGQGTVLYGPPQKAWDAVMANQAALGANYGRVQGEDFLHSQVRAKLRGFNHIKHSEETQALLITAGANMAFLHALLAISDPGDEIILPRPYYFNHDMAICMLGCTTVGVDTQGNYQLNLDTILAAITPRTRAIVTVSPNNPSGAVYSKESLQAVNDLCRQQGLYHISDEAYEYFTFAGQTHYSPASASHSAEHTISLFSLSKAYGFASWRVGYMLVPQHLLSALRQIQDTNLICVSLVAQYAAAGALQAGIGYCQEQLAQIRQNRLTLLAALQQTTALNGPICAEGAFYIFINVATGLSDFAATEKLIKDFGVAVIPGRAFGMQHGCYLRIAYGALDEDSLATATKRLQQGMTALATIN